MFQLMQNIHVLQAEGNLIGIQLELHFYTEMGRKEGDRKVSNIVGLPSTPVESWLVSEL